MSLLDPGWDEHADKILSIIVLELPLHVHLHLRVGLQNWHRGDVVHFCATLKWAGDVVVLASVGVSQREGHGQVHDDAVHFSLDVVHVYRWCEVYADGGVGVPLEDTFLGVFGTAAHADHLHGG